MSSVQLRPTPDPGGDQPVSVGRLFEEYSDRIYGYCLRRLGSSADAEDAVQMTFLCAHRAVQRGTVPESESAWLFAIAKNVCRWQQRTIFRRNRLLSDAELDAIASPARADDEELLVGLKDALASIPETQQRALVLREWHGLTSREVASQLGMSQPATYALLTRARRSLAHALTALPQQAALGVVALVYDARSHIKALFGGGVAVKTVAATTVVAAVAVGGVTAGKAIDGDRSVPQAPQPGLVETGDGSSQRVELRLGPGGVSDAVSGTTLVRGSSSTAAVPASGDTGAIAGEPSTPSSPSGEHAVPPSRTDDVGGETNSDLVGLPAGVPETPPLPAPPLPPLPTEVLPPLPPLPTDLIPPLPPVPTLPPLPTDVLPPAPEPLPIPSPSLPSVDLPPPPVDLSPPTLPDPPPIPDLLP